MVLYAQPLLRKAPKLLLFFKLFYLSRCLHQLPLYFVQVSQIPPDPFASKVQSPQPLSKSPQGLTPIDEEPQKEEEQPEKEQQEIQREPQESNVNTDNNGHDQAQDPNTHPDPNQAEIYHKKVYVHIFSLFFILTHFSLV